MNDGTSWRGLRLVLLGLELLVAVNAVTAGTSLAVRPDGSGLGMTVALLARSPFRDFLVPGLLLALAVGGSACAAAVALLARARRAPELALAAGAILAGWIVVQAVLIGVFGLQLVLLGIALAEVALAWRLRAVMSQARD